jgi:hypothetical protein
LNKLTNNKKAAALYKVAFFIRMDYSMITLSMYYKAVFALCVFYGCCAMEKEEQALIPIMHNGKIIDYAYTPDPCGGCDSNGCAAGCCCVGSMCGVAQTVNWACINQEKTLAEGCNPGCMNAWFTPCDCPTVGDAVHVAAEWSLTTCTVGLLFASCLTYLIPKCREKWGTKKRPVNERSSLLMNSGTNNNNDSGSDSYEG